MSTRVKLGRDQVLTLDGTALEGVRELDIDMPMSTHDVTSWWHAWKSTLPLAADATVKVLIYWQENYADFAEKFNKHPPDPLTLGISNVGVADFVPVNISVKQPIAGVMAWEVTLRLWTYGKP